MGRILLLARTPAPRMTDVLTFQPDRGAHPGPGGNGPLCNRCLESIQVDL